MKMQVNISEIHKISLKEGEVLIVRLPDNESQETMGRFRKYLGEMLETKRVIVYCGQKIEFLKLGLEEALVDELIEKELRK